MWGRDRVASEVEKRAKETIDPYLLETDDALRRRVLTMDFEEVVARMGFVEYKGVAKFELATPAQALNVTEDTTIQHGLHGSFRVLQLDQDGDVSRETIYDNGVFFVRNGGGEMRVQGIIKDQHLTIRDEAWQPLRVFTSYFGPRAGLKKVGASNVNGRAAAKYTFSLLPGPDLITVKGMEGAKRPVSLSGELYADEATGVPIKVSLKGLLEIAGAAQKEAQGKLNLTLNYALKTIEGQEIKPKSFVPTIKRHPVDLAPLSFLDGGIATSTVIGGKKPKMVAPPPHPELPATLTTSAAKPASKP